MAEELSETITKLRALLAECDKAETLYGKSRSREELRYAAARAIPALLDRIAELEKAAAEAKAERFGIQCVNNYAVGLDGVARLIPSPHNTPDAPLTK